MIATVIHVDLDLEFFPRNLVTGLASAAAARRRPERCKLGRAQPNLAFFPRRPASNFKGQKRALAFFSQPDVTTAWLTCEITLRDWEMTRSQDFDWQPLDQKLPLDLAR